MRGLGADPRQSTARRLRAPGRAAPPQRASRKPPAVGGRAPLRRAACRARRRGRRARRALAEAARALLRPETTDVAAAAREIAREHGDAAAREAAAALVALERNVGVPRDMAAQPAGAMRVACALIASGLDVAATEAGAAGA